MGRDRAVWVATVVWVRLMISAWAAPQLNNHHLEAEHRLSSLDILASLPSASNDMFIWNGPDGSYRFGMHGQDQWRFEVRYPSGNVYGRYAYKTPDGQTVDVFYDAGPQGYRARGDAIPGGGAPLIQYEVAKVGDQRISDESIVSDSLPEIPYGALRTVDEEQKFPSGNGVTTYTDDSNKAIITDLKPEYASPIAVFRVLRVPSTDDLLIGPAIVDDQPLRPAAIYD